MSLSTHCLITTFQQLRPNPTRNCNNRIYNQSKMNSSNNLVGTNLLKTVIAFALILSAHSTTVRPSTSPAVDFRNHKFNHIVNDEGRALAKRMRAFTANYNKKWKETGRMELGSFVDGIQYFAEESKKIKYDVSHLPIDSRTLTTTTRLTSCEVCEIACNAAIPICVAGCRRAKGPFLLVCKPTWDAAHFACKAACVACFS